MAFTRRVDVINTVLNTKLVPLYFSLDLEEMKNIITACYNGGARVFEYTNRGSFAHETFGELNKWCMEKYPDMYLGVGSISEPSTAALFIQLGAKFIVSPALNLETGKLCNRRKVAWIPGCGSLTEMQMAEEQGAEIVKMFPGKELGGPSYIKAVTAPCPWSLIMPSGGVSPTEENISEWLGAGAACVGIGSQLFPKDLIAKKDYKAIEAKIADCVAIIEKVTK